MNITEKIDLIYKRVNEKFQIPEHMKESVKEGIRLAVYEIDRKAGNVDK